MKTVALALALLCLAGCAALPMPLQPKHPEYSSAPVEAAWIGLDAVDTVQTMHMRAGTSCDHEGDPVAARLYGGVNPPAALVLAVNVLLAAVHASVSSWLDDKVAEHADDGSAGPWYVGRIAWYVLSFAYSADGVAKGREQHCSL